MYVYDSRILSGSDYYIYTPSLTAKKLYLYPLSIGHYLYDANYFLNRTQFNSFLLMYIKKGCCTISTNNSTITAKRGQFVLLNCYFPHSYGSPEPWEVFWMHFDGQLAQNFFEEITSRNGFVFTPFDSLSAFLSLEKIYTFFHSSLAISEPIISASITELLNYLLQTTQTQINLCHSTSISNTIAYINQHFHKDLSIVQLAQKANLSPYHFIRVFTKETGVTPYQYLMDTRIAAAKFLLKTSDILVKDIAFRTGFQSESSFCTCFKKIEQLTPSEYRKREEH